MKKKTIRKYLLAAAGVLAVGLAALGLVLPVLPTTPFLLLAAALFLRSSERLYGWLMNHRILGPYIRMYRRHRALTVQTKVGTMALLWSTILFTSFVVLEAWWLRIVLLLIASGVSVHVLGMKTLTRSMLEDYESSCGVGVEASPDRQIS